MVKKLNSIVEVRRKVAKTHEMISTAYHESGHTIYALLHHMRVDSVLIFEAKSKRIDGFTNYLCPDTDSGDLDLIDNLVKSEIGLMYAGLAAEKYHFKASSGSDSFPMVLNGASEDIKSAARLIIKYRLCPPGRKRYLYKQRIIRGVLRELQAHWEAVSIVSHALFKHRRLSFDDLQKLLCKKSKNKNFWKEQFKNINKLYTKEKYDELELKTLLFK